VVGATLRLLGNGDEGEGGEIPTEYEVEQSSDEGTAGALSALNGAAYTGEGRCKGCFVFRGEPHEPDCPVGQAERALAGTDAPDAAAAETERQQAALEQAASGAKPSGAPPIPVDTEPMVSR
jgi:hypothetical protein